MELDHPSHPEHKLTYYKEVVVKKGGNNVMVCKGCRGEISSEHYSCRECKFFLHKLCAERPLELTHSSHPLHPLRLLHESPYDYRRVICSACNDIVSGFTYHCAICWFDLCFICPFPSDGFKLRHICQLAGYTLTYKKSMKRADDDKVVVCVACSDGISSEHYIYGDDFLHKLCAERPLEITHSSHPLHPLRLLTLHPYGDIRCKGCTRTVEGYLYHCAICNFDLDFICAFPDDGLKVNHPCHQSHVLNYEKVVKRADKGIVCAACLEQISGPLENYYSCRECNFFLHELCFQRPRELTSSLHPEHPLHLLPKYPSSNGKGYCNGCRKGMRGFVYKCDTCNFCIDFICAFPEPEKSIQIFDNVHDHPLMIIPKPAKFNCDVCSLSQVDRGDVKEDESLICSIPTCHFWIHKLCAFETLAQRYKDHHHPLSLIQGVPEDLKIYNIFCYVCRKTINPTGLVSWCARCTFFVHINCLMTHDLSSPIKDDADYLYDSFIKLLLNGDEFVHWPKMDISSELIQPFLIGENSIMDVHQLEIRHLSHMEHNMILFQELCVNTKSFFEEEDEEIMCNACIHPITAPYYCCQECNYYLHLACANLPPRIQHSSHPHHALFMRYPNKFYDDFTCNRCDNFSNGFSYSCRRCKFSLDLTCAALPVIIMLETHEHPLLQMEAKDEGACYACGQSIENGGTIFKCIHCDNIFLSFSCAMRARSIRHRWDRHHPLDLKIPPHDHAGQFMCDMCEEFIHPMYWLYSCFQCEISFHPGCAPKYWNKYISYPNIKFGGEVSIRSHDHVLKYLRKATLKALCDKCGNNIKWQCVFECETCYYCICRPCMKYQILLVGL